jgi:hypothetical protein
MIRPVRDGKVPAHSVRNLKADASMKTLAGKIRVLMSLIEAMVLIRLDYSNESLAGLPDHLIPSLPLPHD